MDNPKPDATHDVRSDEPEARRRRDAGVPLEEERVDRPADRPEDTGEATSDDRDAG
jgi:hypothetical protein